MCRAAWEAIDPKIRDMIISAFKMAGINFEMDYVVSEDNDSGKPSDDSPWISRKQAAAYARCSVDSIDNWIADGQIVRLKTASTRPGLVLIEKVSLEKFLRSKIINPKKRVRQISHSIPGGYRVQSNN